MNIFITILLIVFIVICIVSFVLASYLERKERKNSEYWFSNHTKSEGAIVKDYLNFRHNGKVEKNNEKHNIKTKDNK